MGDKFYTVQEIADVLKVDKRTILSLIKNKKLSATNVGTAKKAHWRIYEGQYRKFLAENYQ